MTIIKLNWIENDYYLQKILMIKKVVRKKKRFLYVYRNLYQICDPTWPMYYGYHMTYNVFCKNYKLKPEPGLISHWNCENLNFILPEIMCLKCFSRDTDSFPVEYKSWKPNLRWFFQRFSLEKWADNSYKKRFNILKRSMTYPAFLGPQSKWSKIY